MLHQRHSSVTDTTQGVIWKQLMVFFLPIFLGTLLQQLYNTVDAVIVGRFVGKEALAAVGVTGTPISLFLNFFVGLSSGAGVVISHLFGAKDDDGLDQAIHTSLLLAVIGSVVLTVLGFALTDVLLLAVNTQPEYLDGARLYMRVYFLGISTLIFYNMGTGIFRALGNSRFPMYVLSACCIVNILGDLLFVAVLRLGILGAALATVMSETVSAVLVIAGIMRLDVFHFSLKKMHFGGGMMGRILRIGAPAAIQAMMYPVSNMVVDNHVNSFGVATTAAMTSLARLDGIYWLTMNSISISVLTFVGQNYGAKKMDRVRGCIRSALVIELISAVFFTTVMLVFGGQLLTIFTSDADVIAIGRQIILMISPFYGTFILNDVFSTVLRGVGNSVTPLIITFTCICLLRVVWLSFIAPLNHTLAMVMACYPITWILASLVILVYTNFGRKIVPEK